MLLIDCDVPFIGGCEASRQIRNFEGDEAGKLPIIGMSSNASDKQKAQCNNSGMSDYVDKPIGLLELRAMLLKWTSYKTSLISKEIFEASGNQFSSFSQPKSKKVNYDTQSLSRPYR